MERHLLGRLITKTESGRVLRPRSSIKFLFWLSIALIRIFIDNDNTSKKRKKKKKPAKVATNFGLG